MLAAALKSDPQALVTIVPQKVERATSRELATAWAELATDIDRLRRRVAVDPTDLRHWLITRTGEVVLPNEEDRVER